MGNAILKWDLKEMWYESVYWIHLSQHTYEWRAFMDIEIALRVPYKVRNVLSG
jgi:hypothetical protein